MTPRSAQRDEPGQSGRRAPAVTDETTPAQGTAPQSSPSAASTAGRTYGEGHLYPKRGDTARRAPSTQQHAAPSSAGGRAAHAGSASQRDGAPSLPWIATTRASAQRVTQRTAHRVIRRTAHGAILSSSTHPLGFGRVRSVVAVRRRDVLRWRSALAERGYRYRGAALRVGADVGAWPAARNPNARVTKMRGSMIHFVCSHTQKK